MINLLYRHLYIGVVLVLMFVLFAAGAYSAEPRISRGENLENLQLDRVDAVLAKLSEEQLRNLLITELTKSVLVSEDNSPEKPELYSGITSWLHIVDADDDTVLQTRIGAVLGSGKRLPENLRQIFLQFNNGSSMSSSVLHVFLILLILLAGCTAEFVFKRFTPNFHNSLAFREIPQLNGYMRFWAGVIRQFASLADVAVFTIVVFLFFFITSLIESEGSRYLFLAILLTILVVRVGALLSHLLCSPDFSALRLLSLSDSAAKTAHRITLFVLAYITLGLSSIAVLSELGMPNDGSILIIITLGSLLLFLTGGILLKNRQAIADYIVSAESADIAGNWVIRQFARLWYIPAVLYLLFVWMLFLHNQILQVQQQRHAFLLSLLVVPLLFIADRLGHWVVKTTVKILKIYRKPEAGKEEEEAEELSVEEKKNLLIVKVFRGVRAAILLALFGWIIHIWGYQLPYLSTVATAVFQSLITMALALFAWHLISDYIEKKMIQDEPDKPVEEEEEEDSEWGSSTARGRAYTLLPMVRKFIGTVLVIIVILMTLSTIGIEIGPLLAGAGVVGLAVGFGAQKLVSDIFSGFFFLLDDAFRVGEYLEAGGVSGAVEGITLRNILLRHHRGMLQIVPYSELGSITNYMRGGIVVKFNLEFPYDTDIDLVRRIIKKVGKAMLEDEEFGKDFIRPVKSQGVREITNSVMVIRVKFTAQPGTHFVIRREAYRRITEALATKGIHYAHRKVIVELPENQDTTGIDKQKIAESGAAAGLAAESQPEQATS